MYIYIKKRSKQSEEFARDVGKWLIDGNESIT